MAETAAKAAAAKGDLTQTGEEQQRTRAAAAIGSNAEEEKKKKKKKKKRKKKKTRTKKKGKKIDGKYPKVDKAKEPNIIPPVPMALRGGGRGRRRPRKTVRTQRRAVRALPGVSCP